MVNSNYQPTINYQPLTNNQQPTTNNYQLTLNRQYSTLTLHNIEDNFSCPNPYIIILFVLFMFFRQTVVCQKNIFEKI